MKEQTTIPKRVKGTVLFTVVAVMMVMIVFLAGTLALATTASNRAYSKYQKVQTESIARAVLDAVGNAIAEDTDASGICKDIEGQRIIPVTMGDSGVTYEVQPTKTGAKQTFRDGDEWKEYEIYALSVTVDKTLADTTYTAYTALALDTQVGWKWVKDGDTKKSSGGAFVAMGGSSKIGTGGLITGGTYVGIDAADPEEYTVCDNDVRVEAPFYANRDVKTGNGHYLTFHFSAPGDFFAMSGNFTESQANQLTPDYTGFSWEDIIVRDSEGNIQYQSDGTTPQKSMSYKQTPYIYVGGDLKLHSNSHTVIGKVAADGETPEIPTNVYCGTFQGSSGVTIYGDLYTFGTGKSSLGASGYIPNLYKWVDDNITITDKPASVASVYGNWFSKGDVEFYVGAVYGKNNQIQGDLRSEKNITFTGSGTVTINGDLVAGETLTIPSGVTVKVTGNVYAKNISNSGSIASGAEGMMSYYYHVDESNFPEWKGNGNYELPVKVSKVIILYDDSDNEVSRTETLIYDDKFTASVNNGWHDNGWINTLNSKLPADAQKDNDFINHNDYNIANDGKTHQTDKKVGSIGTVAQKNITDYTKDIYPSDYNPDVKDESGTVTSGITKTIGLEIPTKDDYSDYYKSESDIGSWQVINDIDYFTSDPKSANYYLDETDSSATKGCYVIKANCILNNITFDKNVYVDPSADTSIVMNNCSFNQGCSLIADESSKAVKLYVKGKLDMTDKSSILTKYYWDLFTGGASYGTATGTYTGGSDDLAIKASYLDTSTYSDPEKYKCPNLIIHSVGTGASLSLSKNNAMVTALIQAPEMDFTQTIGVQVSNKITYTNIKGVEERLGKGAGTDGYNAKEEYVGVIGQLISHDINIPNNGGWTLIYTSIDDGTDGSGGGSGSGSGKMKKVPDPESTVTVNNSKILYYNNY